jgi:hypothetical protein
MAAANTDKLTEVGAPGTATTLAAPGHTIGGTTLNVVSTANWPTATGAVFAMDTVTLVNGEEVRVPGSYRELIGVVTSATSIGSIVFLVGADANYPAGSTTRVYIPVASSRENRLVQALSTSIAQDGSLKTAAVQTALNLGTASLNGWNPLAYTLNTVAFNGTRNYTLTFNGVDLTGIISNGMPLKFTRTVTAPIQCTSLNGTTQYYSKSSPAGMTFTDDFAVSAWVKLNSYNGSVNVIASRYNGTSGWDFNIDGTTGGILMRGYNAGSSNVSQVQSYQAIPLNRWVHVAGQLDMSGFTATTTTSFVMIDGVDVTGVVSRGGTNPTALVQAGNLEIGGRNGGLLPFNGKIAQVAIYSAKVTQATIAASSTQTLSGGETSIISAYSFNNTINDLNVSNANNLTANNSAVATNADSPYAGGANAVGGFTAGTTEYGEVFSVSFSTNTTVVVQVPDGYVLPTSGGITTTNYSTSAKPIGWPGAIVVLGQAQLCQNSSAFTGGVAAIPGLSVPIYVPSGRRIKVTTDCGSVLMSGAGTPGLSVWNGTVGSGTRYQFSDLGATASYDLALRANAVVTPAASGSQTIAAGLQTTASNATVQASGTAPSFVLVELE